jgi:hypothetical protein
VSRAVIEVELERRLGMSAAEVSVLLPKLGTALALLLSLGELAQTRGQLPEELRAVLPDPSLAHAGASSAREP